MTPTGNPWTDCFNPQISDQELKAQLGRQGRCLSDLGRYPVELAKETLITALQEVIVVTMPVASTIRALMAPARFFAEQAYPNLQSFLNRVYSENAPTAIAPICLTGLSGVGKSVVIECFHRLCIERTIDVPGHSSFVLAPSRFLRPEAGAGINQILTPLLRMTDGDRPRDVIKLVRTALARAGTSMLEADEFQFLNQGSGSTHLAKTLMQLSRLGPPMVYATNYSLLHKLLNRPQEERQRLLSNVIVIQPDAIDSQDWNDLLTAYLDIAPEFGKLSVADCGSVVHRYTHGLKRLVVRLLANAYAAMRERNGKRVEQVDLTAAYQSRHYASDRADIELLIKIDSSGIQPKRRRDLWCPLREVPSVAKSNSGLPKPAETKQQRELAEALAAASMGAEERGAHVRVKRAERSTSGRKKPEQTRRPTPTKESLLKAAQSFAGKIAKGD